MEGRVQKGAAARPRVRVSAKDLLGMTAGPLLMSTGVYFFKIPNGFSLGGVSGLATVLGHLRLLPFLTPAVLILVLNVVLLALGTLLLGRSNLWRTVYCSLLFSLTTWIFERVVPLDAPLTDQPLLELCCGILLGGIGAAMIFRAHASSGGTDILALIFKKYTSLDVGTALFVADVAIAGSSFAVFGLRTGLFSLLGLLARSFLVDGVLERLNRCTCFLIVTARPAPIVDYILGTLHRSATTVEAEGAYTHEPRQVILTICRRAEGAHLQRALRTIDPAAFVIVQAAGQPIGRGFPAE